MPAPRSASASLTRSNTSTCQPERCNRFAANKPPSEPPMTSALRTFARASRRGGFVCRIIQLDHDSAGIIKKNLMEIEVRHGALAMRHFILLQLLQHLFKIGCGKCDVVDSAGAAVQSVQIPFAQIIIEPL